MAADIENLGRRGFLTGRLAPARNAIRPPWSRNETLAAACTGCGACAEACPQAIVRLGAGQWPQIDFSRNDCTFCGRCAEACPEPVFDRAIPAFPHVALIGEACFAARGVVCQSCGDACPAGAIRFRPRLGGPALPSLAADRCTGCGACIATCPADSIAVMSPIAEPAHV
ncbi:ferredoxin-type protein NapF [Bosea sp. (in: a-proteobacteria)]|uniref:ferredoxin-type protein NapF n=1 Tax=Bosea sp. (in: a-proteobacteria) TaxID=1871050 RepID=UPI002FC8EC10